MYDRKNKLEFDELPEQAPSTGSSGCGDQQYCQCGRVIDSTISAKYRDSVMADQSSRDACRDIIMDDRFSRDLYQSLHDDLL